MPSSHHAFTQLNLHLVWTTYRRQPLIRPEDEARLYDFLRSKVTELEGHYLVGNGMADHVHLLISLPTTTSIDRLVGALKGASSHFVNHRIRPGYPFRWQQGYGAFSVSEHRLATIIGYIIRQKEHHAPRTGV